MSDKIREAFDAWLKTLDKARDDNGLMPLTSREVDILRNGHSVGWKAALAQQPAPAAPAGWKLVPVEPTIDMLRSGVQRELAGASHYGRLRDTYRAMLAAAPEYAAPVVQEPVAWQVRNGVVTHGFYRSEAEASEVAFDMQKAHSLGGSLAAFNVRPVYTAPPAAEQPDTVAVPRELLERAVDRLTHGHELDKACRELRALLGKEGEA